MESLGDDNSVLPVPNHVVLNHLGTSAIKNGVLAVGTTTRYHRKVRPVSHIPNELTACSFDPLFPIAVHLDDLLQANMIVTNLTHDPKD